MRYSNHIYIYIYIKNMTSIKIIWQDDTRRVSASTINTFRDLQRSCLRKFKGSGLETPFSLKYFDEDGDQITIGSDEELEEAFRVSEEVGHVLKVRIWAAKSKSVRPEASTPHHTAHTNEDNEKDEDTEKIDDEALNWMASRLATFGVEKKAAVLALEKSGGNVTAAASSLMFREADNEGEDEADVRPGDERLENSTGEHGSSTGVDLDQEQEHSEEKPSRRKAAKKPGTFEFLQEGNPEELKRLVFEGQKYVDNMSSKADEIAAYLKTQNNVFNRHWHRATKDIVRDARCVGGKLQKKILKSARKNANRTYVHVLSTLKKDANEEFFENLRVAVKDAKKNVKDMRTEARELVQRAKLAIKRNNDTVAASAASSSSPLPSSSCPCTGSSSSDDDEQVKFAKESARALYVEARRRKEELLKAKRKEAKAIRRRKMEIAKEEAEAARTKALEKARHEARRVRHQVIDGVKAVSERMRSVLDSVESEPESDLTGDDSSDAKADSAARATTMAMTKGESALLAMGFEDKTANASALRETCGDVGRAVAILLSRPT